MDAGKNLKVISNFAVGFNNIEIEEATKRNIWIGNTPGVLTDSTADMAFCLLIGAARQLTTGYKAVLDDKWKTWEPLGYIGQDLVGKTVGIFGMGRIGYQLAHKCHHGFGMKVLYYDVNTVDQAETDLKAERVDMDTLCAQSDFLSIHCNLDASTEGLFDASVFKKMKKNAVLVNTARGPVVKEDDLYEALRNGEIFSAGVDVTNPEPMELDNPLLTLPNFVVAPHIASATVKTRNAMADICATNLINGLKGVSLQHAVNKLD